MLRFAMNHPTRVHGIVAINTEGIASASIQEKLVRWREVLFLSLIFPNAGERQGQTCAGSQQQVSVVNLFI